MTIALILTITLNQKVFFFDFYKEFNNQSYSTVKIFLFYFQDTEQIRLAAGNLGMNLMLPMN